MRRNRGRTRKRKRSRRYHTKRRDKPVKGKVSTDAQFPFGKATVGEFTRRAMKPSTWFGQRS